MTYYFGPENCPNFRTYSAYILNCSFTYFPLYAHVKQIVYMSIGLHKGRNEFVIFLMTYEMDQKKTKIEENVHILFHLLCQQTKIKFIALGSLFYFVILNTINSFRCHG